MTNEKETEQQPTTPPLTQEEILEMYRDLQARIAHAEEKVKAASDAVDAACEAHENARLIRRLAFRAYYDFVAQHGREPE